MIDEPTVGDVLAALANMQASLDSFQAQFTVITAAQDRTYDEIIAKMDRLHGDRN